MIIELIASIVIFGLGYLVGKGYTLSKIEAEVRALETSFGTEERKLAADIKSLLHKLGL